MQLLEPRQLLHGTVDLSINFAPKRVPGVEGMLNDVGLLYGDRGDGLIYGWQKDNTKNARDRNLIGDQSLDTLAMLQVNGGRKKWEIELPNGEYDVTVASGDARYVDSVNHINVEGLNVVKTTPSVAHPFNIKTRTITVADGKLTVRPGADAENAKINWIRIQTVHTDGGEEVPTTPSVSASAVDATATEGDADDAGQLRLTRDGDVTAELTVNLEWSGTADASDVTSPRPTNVTFAAGQTVIDLPVVAAADDLDEPLEGATLTVVAGTGYTVGTTPTASVAITNVTPLPDPDPEPTPDPVLTGITWAKTGGPPSTFSETTSEVVNGKMFLFGGYNAAFSPQNKVYRFDGTTWTTLNNSPIGFTHVGSAVVGNKIWFAGGYVSNGSGGQIFGTDVVRIYDTTNDSWTSVLNLPANRSAGALVRVGRKLHFFGGLDSKKRDKGDHWELDLRTPTKWITRAAMPDPRNHLGYTLAGTKMYAVGGQHDLNEDTGNDAAVHAYDVLTGTWSAVARLPRPTSHTHNSTFAIGEKVIAVGGSTTGENSLTQVMEYDPSTNKWRERGTLPVALSATASQLIAGHILVSGGTTSGSRPENDTWINV
jgi:N-acetylneuraminic acid mutarotase